MIDKIPLYEKIRPKTLDEVLGNKNIIDILKRWIINSNIRSFIIYGPPGSGKTTIVKAFMSEIKKNYDISYFSGAVEGAKTLRNLVKKDSNLFSKKQLVFIDEIHRLNKSEQDILLLSVENKDIILFGATTENPSVTINSALLSRVNVFKTSKLEEKSYDILFSKIEQVTKKKISIDAREILINYSPDDVRRIINVCEVVSDNVLDEITKDSLNNVITGINYYSRTNKYEFISAFIKSVRGSDPDAALLYLAYMLENGEDPIYIARRIVLLASEDIGLADPNALNIAVSALVSTEKIGYPECYLPLAEATIYLAVASKSNSVHESYNRAKEFVKYNKIEVPKKFINPVNKEMKKQGFGEGYKYPHDYGGFVKNSYMPEEYKKIKFYIPGNNNVEKRIFEKMKFLWKELKDY